MKKNWARIYNDRRDRYGITFLLKNRAVRIFYRDEKENPLVSLIDKGILKNLINLKILQPIAEKKFKKRPFSVLTQKRIIPAIMPSEWCSLMHVEAAELVLNTELVLMEHDFTLDDVHPWNILFDGAKPYLVDLGAINFLGTDLHWAKENSSFWPAARSFKAMSMNPIFLFAAGKNTLARRVLQDYYSFSNFEILLLLIRKSRLFMWFILNYFSFFVSNNKKSYLTKELLWLNKIRKFITENNHYSEDKKQNLDPLLKEIEASLPLKNAKSVTIYSKSLILLESIRKNTRTSITAISSDESFANSIYAKKYEKMSVVILDLRSPTPGVGPMNAWISPALNRFSSEVGVFVLDMNDLVFEKCMTVREVLETVERLFIENAFIYMINILEKPRLKARDYGQLNKENLQLSLEEVFVIKESKEVGARVALFCVAKKL